MSVPALTGKPTPPDALDPAGSKRTYKAAAERRAEILDCALAAFSEAGYHQTSIADVCARAHIGRATLYQYFADKRDLLVALADRIATRVIDSVSARPVLRIPEGVTFSDEQLTDFVEQRFVDVLRVLFEDAATARLVLRAGRGADGVVDDILRRVDHAVLGRIESELTLAIDAGLVRPLDARFVARFFLGGIEKIVLDWADEDRPLDLAAIAREAALLELFGIRPRAATASPTTATTP